MTLGARITKRLSSQFTLAVDLLAPPGITILFGASGSGKTTILRCLAGLARPDTGRITLGDEVLFDFDQHVNMRVQDRRIGFLFQQPALFPHLSIEQNIGYGLMRLSSDTRSERISQIADSFRIAALLTRKPDQVSGGERQRTALARALVTDPRLLLLDEPLSALDHAIQSSIMDDLRRWNESRRIPILLVTHSHRESYALGEHVIVLEEGRVLTTGSPHEVLDHPAHEVVAALAGFENLFEAVVVDRHEGGGTMQCRLGDSTTVLEVPTTQARIGDVIRIAIRAGDILVANQEPRGLSARNIMHGRLDTLTAQGPTMVLRVDAGARFIVHLTPGGVQSLQLRPGAPVWLVIKTYSCRIVV